VKLLTKFKKTDFVANNSIFFSNNQKMEGWFLLEGWFLTEQSLVYWRIWLWSGNRHPGKQWL